MNFRYRAIDGRGQEVSGLLEATDLRAADREVLRRGLTPVLLEPDQPAVDAWRDRLPPSPRELQLVLQEFATLVDSGVSLATALTSLSNSSHHPRITGAFAAMAKAVRRGDSFAQALAASELDLPPYIQQLVEASQHLRYAGVGTTQPVDHRAQPQMPQRRLLGIRQLLKQLVHKPCQMSLIRAYRIAPGPSPCQTHAPEPKCTAWKTPKTCQRHGWPTPGPNSRPMRNRARL